MNLEEATDELEIRDDDLKAIREAKDPNWLLRGLVTVAVIIVSTVLGILAGKSSGASGYPYGALYLAPFAAVRRRRVPWLFVICLAVLSFISFSIGVASNDQTFGIVTYYGTFSRKT